MLLQLLRGMVYYLMYPVGALLFLIFVGAVRDTLSSSTRKDDDRIATTNNNDESSDYTSKEDQNVLSSPKRSASYSPTRSSGGDNNSSFGDDTEDNANNNYDNNNHNNDNDSNRQPLVGFNSDSDNNSSGREEGTPSPSNKNSQRKFEKKRRRETNNGGTQHGLVNMFRKQPIKRQTSVDNLGDSLSERTRSFGRENEQDDDDSSNSNSSSNDNITRKEQRENKERRRRRKGTSFDLEEDSNSNHTQSDDERDDADEFDTIQEDDTSFVNENQNQKEKEKRIAVVSSPTFSDSAHSVDGDDGGSNGLSTRELAARHVAEEEALEDTGKTATLKKWCPRIVGSLCFIFTLVIGVLLWHLSQHPNKIEALRDIVVIHVGGDENSTTTNQTSVFDTNVTSLWNDVHRVILGDSSDESSGESSGNESETEMSLKEKGIVKGEETEKGRVKVRSMSEATKNKDARDQKKKEESEKKEQKEKVKRIQEKKEKEMKKLEENKKKIKIEENDKMKKKIIVEEKQKDKIKQQQATKMKEESKKVQIKEKEGKKGKKGKEKTKTNKESNNAKQFCSITGMCPPLDVDATDDTDDTNKTTSSSSWWPFSSDSINHSNETATSWSFSPFSWLAQTTIAVTTLWTTLIQSFSSTFIDVSNVGDVWNSVHNSTLTFYYNTTASVTPTMKYVTNTVSTFIYEYWTRLISMAPGIPTPTWIGIGIAALVCLVACIRCLVSKYHSSSFVIGTTTVVSATDGNSVPLDASTLENASTTTDKKNINDANVAAGMMTTTIDEEDTIEPPSELVTAFGMVLKHMKTPVQRRAAKRFVRDRMFEDVDGGEFYEDGVRILSLFQRTKEDEKEEEKEDNHKISIDDVLNYKYVPPTGHELDIYRDENLNNWIIDEAVLDYEMNEKDNSNHPYLTSPWRELHSLHSPNVLSNVGQENRDRNIQNIRNSDRNNIEEGLAVRRGSSGLSIHVHSPNAAKPSSPKMHTLALDTATSVVHWAVRTSRKSLESKKQRAESIEKERKNVNSNGIQSNEKDDMDRNIAGNGDDDNTTNNNNGNNGNNGNMDNMGNNNGTSGENGNNHPDSSDRRRRRLSRHSLLLQEPKGGRIPAREINALTLSPFTTPTHAQNRRNSGGIGDLMSTGRGTLKSVGNTGPSSSTLLGDSERVSSTGVRAPPMTSSHFSATKSKVSRELRLDEINSGNGKRNNGINGNNGNRRDRSDGGGLERLAEEDERHQNEKGYYNEDDNKNGGRFNRSDRSSDDDEYDGRRRRRRGGGGRNKEDDDEDEDRSGSNKKLSNRRSPQTASVFDDPFFMDDDDVQGNNTFGNNDGRGSSNGDRSSRRRGRGRGRGRRNDDDDDDSNDSNDSNGNKERQQPTASTDRQYDISDKRKKNRARMKDEQKKRLDQMADDINAEAGLDDINGHERIRTDVRDSITRIGQGGDEERWKER